MKVKGITIEDFVNYKKPSMFIAFPYCTFKCDKECGERVCQNSALVNSPDVDVDINALVQRYLSNPITHAIVCGGMEPFDSWNDLHNLIRSFRRYTDDDIVIYTGYEEFDDDDFDNHVETLACLYKNIIIKYGRFRPYQEKHFDEVLGVELASDNQHAERIS